MSIFKQFKLGAKKDISDSRDEFKCARFALSGPPPLPAKATVPFLPPIKDQGQTNSCTGHAVSWFWEQVLVTRGVPYINLSPMFPWYYARREEGVSDKDEGVQMRTIMSALNKYGTCPEEQWAHGSPIVEEPSYEAQLMSVMRLPTYERCTSLHDIKYSIAVEKQSVCIGVLVRDCWYDASVQQNGLVPYLPNQTVLGGHAVAIAGYDDTRQTLLIANSWSPSYAVKGFFEYPYAYLQTDWWDAWTAGFDTLPGAVNDNV